MTPSEQNNIAVGKASSWYTHRTKDGRWFWRAYVGATARTGFASDELGARQQARAAYARLREECRS